VVVTSGGPGNGGFVLEVEVNGQTYKHPQPPENMNKKVAKSEAAKFALKKLGL